MIISAALLLAWIAVMVMVCATRGKARNDDE